MALDPTTGSGSGGKKKKKKPALPAPSPGTGPSQAATEAITNNRRKKRGRKPAPTPAINAGVKEAKQRRRQARIEAKRQAAINLARLQASIHEPMLDPYRGMGPSIAERGAQQYRSDLASMPDYRTFDWKDANIPLGGSLLSKVGGPQIGPEETSPRGIFQSTVWNPNDPLWLNLALGATWFTGPFKLLGAGAEASRAARAGADIAEVGRAARAGHGAGLVGRKYLPRTLMVGGKAVQVPRARSRITRYAIEKPADAASRLLDRTFIRDFPVLKNMTASMRGAKAAGRLRGQETLRSGADLAPYLEGLKFHSWERHGDRIEEAHWWWAQMPAKYRNADGLKLVRGKLAEEMSALQSGERLRSLEGALNQLKAELRATRPVVESTSSDPVEKAFKRYYREAVGEPDAYTLDEFRAMHERNPEFFSRYFQESASSLPVFEGEPRPWNDILNDMEDVKLLIRDLPQQVDDLARAIGRLDDIIKKPPKFSEKRMEALRKISETGEATLLRIGELTPETAAGSKQQVSNWLGIGGKTLPTEAEIERQPSLRYIPVWKDLKTGETRIGEPGGTHSDLGFATAGRGTQGFAVIDNGEVSHINWSVGKGADDFTGFEHPDELKVDVPAPVTRQVLSQVRKEFEKIPAEDGPIYLHHGMGNFQSASPSGFPKSPGYGRPKKPAGVGQQRDLTLAKQGRVDTSFEGVAKRGHQVRVYETAQGVREDLGQIGRPLEGATRYDAEREVLINPKGRVVPKSWKLPKETIDGGFDPEELNRAAKQVMNTFFAEGDENIKALIAAAREQGQLYSELRVVPKDVAERYFDQFVSPGTAGSAARVYDRGVDLMSASIIFARLGYIPKNLFQNVIMAVPHQGAYLLSNAVRAAQVMRDPELYPLIKSEVGFSGATRGLGQEAVSKRATRKIIGFVGTAADDPMRISAFLHEAAAMKVISRVNPFLTEKDRAALLTLLRDKSQRPLLNDVKQRGVEAMGDFTRMTPKQRRYARRLLIIPGWLMAGSRYPFHFAATHPVRSALLAYIAMGEPGAPDRFQLNDPITHYMAKGLPSWAQGIQTPWGVERTTSISPVNTPWDVLQAGLYRRDSTVMDYINPLIAAGWHIGNGELTSPDGTYKVPLNEAIAGNLKRLAPNYDLIKDLIAPSDSKFYPEDSSRFGRFKRELGIVPIEMSKDPYAKKSPAQEKATDISTLRSQYKKWFKKPLPQKLADTIGYRYEIEKEEKELQDHLSVDHLSEAQRTAIRLRVAETIPAFQPYVSQWQKAYQDALGDPLDFPHGEGDLPNGRMHALRGVLEDKVLGYGYLSTVTTAIRHYNESVLAGR